MNDNGSLGIRKEAFISYLDDENKIIKGFVEILEKTENYIKFKNRTNTITISYNRLLKLKEANEHDL